MRVKISKIIVLSLCYFFMILGCSSAGKDIHFRSRLPTQEVPFLGASEIVTFGAQMELENQRVTFQPTKNLVNLYSVSEDKIYFSTNENSLNGADVSLYLQRNMDLFPYRFSLSLDFAELQFVFGTSDSDYFANLNAGIYKTAAYISTGSNDCFLFCEGRNEAELKEQQITTNQSGTEKKIGFSIGKRWAEKRLIFVYSHQWMNYQYSANVTKAGSPELILQESYFGYGNGIGFYNETEKKNLFGLTVDSIKLSWRSRDLDQVVWGIRGNLNF